MSSICPVCNGFQALSVRCPRCASMSEDEGRFNDWLGPYSPYRPIDEIGMNNGWIDVRHHVCVHVVRCPDCRHTFHVVVQEWQP